MHTFDQLDASSLAVGEHLSRWVIQTELAVERNPLQPDFSGLDIIEGSAALPDGRANTSKFTEWVTGRLKERATIWKQERLYNQERRQLRTRGGRGDDGGSSSEGDGPGKGKQRKNKKKKKGKGEETSGAAQGGASSSK